MNVERIVVVTAIVCTVGMLVAIGALISFAEYIARVLTVIQ